MFGLVQRASTAVKSPGPATEDRVVAINDPAMLRELVSRSPGPSFPQGSRVHLNFLDKHDPRRAHMEAELSRYIPACGCEAAAVASLLVLATLATGQFVFSIRVPLHGILPYVAWGVLAATVGAITKLSFLYYAHRRLLRVYRNASTMLQGSSA